MPTVYLDIDKETADVLEQMRLKLAKEFGVTVVGNRCTVRWYDEQQNLLQVHMVIENVTTPSECQELREQIKRYAALVKKYPWLSEEMHLIEHGEHSK